MTSVSRKEGFRYGFYVFAYWLVLLAFSATLAAAGGILVTVRNEFSSVPSEVLIVLGGFVGFLGVLVFGAGQTGLAYKVVADGVATGTGAVARGAGNATPSESETDEEGESVEGVESTTDDSHGQTTEQPGTEPSQPASPTAAPSEGAGAIDGETGDAEAAGDEVLADEDEATDAFESGGFEPARTDADADRSAAETDADTGADTGTDPGTDSASGPENSPVDVASESEIAEELGFGDSETAGEGVPDTASTGDDTGRDPGTDESPPTDGSPPVDESPSADDPLTPDSGFVSPESEEPTPSEPATEPVENSDTVIEADEPDEFEETNTDPEDSDWTTGEDHVNTSNSSNERDE